MRKVMVWSALLGVVCCTGAVEAVGCGGDDTFTANGALDAGLDATANKDATLPDTGVGDAATDGNTDGNILDSGLIDAADAGDAAFEVLNDDQIVQVLHASNAGEVSEGTLAETNAVTPAIQNLAMMFVQMHGMADATLLATAADAGSHRGNVLHRHHVADAGGGRTRRR